MLTKPLIVFVPGLGATSETYKPFLAMLQNQYEVRVAELPLDFPKELDWDFFFKAIDRAAGEWGQFILLGHSMGANTSLAYTAKHPNRVIKTVLVAPPVLPKEGIGVRGLAQFRWYRRLQNFALGLLGGTPGHSLETIRIRSRVLAGERRHRLYDWINHQDLRPLLPKLKNIFVLWPKREEVLAIEHYDELSRHPGITVKKIRGSHNNIALYPRPILGDILEALDG